MNHTAQAEWVLLFTMDTVGVSKASRDEHLTQGVQRMGEAAYG